MQHTVGALKQIRHLARSHRLGFAPIGLLFLDLLDDVGGTLVVALCLFDLRFKAGLLAFLACKIGGGLLQFLLKQQRLALPVVLPLAVGKQRFHLTDSSDDISIMFGDGAIVVFNLRLAAVHGLLRLFACHTHLLKGFRSSFVLGAQPLQFFLKFLAISDFGANVGGVLLLIIAERLQRLFGVGVKRVNTAFLARFGSFF